MITGRSIRTVYLPIIFVAAAALCFLIPYLPLQKWAASLILTITIIMIAGIVIYHLATREQDQSLPQSSFISTALPPAERREERVTNVLLPTNRDDYYFLFSATVIWLPVRGVKDEPRTNMAALAVDAVLTRARIITDQRDPGNASLVQHELASSLGEIQIEDTRRLQVMAESVQLTLPEDDQERLNKLAAVRKEEAIWEHERKYEQSRREYLSEDVLKNPGSAVVWWLSRNDDHVEKTVQDIGLLSQLTSAAHDRDIPSAFSDLRPWPTPEDIPDSPYHGPNGSDGAQSSESGVSATDHFGAFLLAINLGEHDPQRCLFARQVADLAARHGRQEVAEEIVRRFDVSEATDDPSDLGKEADGS